MSDKLVAPNTKYLRQLMEKMCSIDDEVLDLTVDDLELVSKAVDELRTNILFSADMDDEDFGPLSMQDYLLGLNALEQAQRHFAKAALWQTAEVGRRVR